MVNYHMSNSDECMGVNGEAMHLHIVYKKLYFYYKSLDYIYNLLTESLVQSSTV